MTGLRRVVAVLSTVQIVSWGVLYYAFAALQSSVTAETGWSGVAVTGAFSLAQFVFGGVGIWVGRHIDEFGPRRVMTAGSIVAVPGITTAALAPNLPVFYLGWVLIGVAMAGTPFLRLAAANALVSLAAFAVLINLVPMLVEQGLSRNTAALTLGLGGVGQVIGRLGCARFAAATSVTSRTVSVIVALGVATAALALVPASTGLLIAVSMALGLARGIYTLVQATAVTERCGAARYGTLNGVLTAPALIAAAAAPFLGAALAHLLRGYSAAFLVLAGLAAVAAALSLGAAPRPLVRSID